MKFPDDLDARSFYALSWLCLTGSTRNTANYMRAAAEAEAVYEIDPRHPGALHYLVHAYDDPVQAPLGLRAARRYGKVAPAAAHAQHMPSHIFFALGMWDDAIEANVASLATARSHGQGGYHALEWLEYAYLQRGMREDAAQLVKSVADEVARKPTQGNRTSLAYDRAMWLVPDLSERAWTGERGWTLHLMTNMLNDHYGTQEGVSRVFPIDCETAVGRYHAGSGPEMPVPAGRRE